METSLEQHCPLCGAHNHCAMAAGEPASGCWCTQVQVAPEALEALPEDAVGKYCLCRSCATQSGDKDGR